MQENEEAKAYVRYVMERLAIAPTALAAMAGLSATTLTRPLNDPEHRFTLSNSTLAKVGAATGISFSDYLRESAKAHDDVKKLRTKSILAAVRATVEAGAWREVDQLDQSEPDWVTIDPDPRFPDVTHDIYKVAGDSMNRLEPNPITPGSRVVALRYDEISNRYPLRDGLIVVVQRAREGGHILELSIKQVAWFSDRIEFRPRSSNPAHKPIVVEHDSWDDNGTTVEIVGLVTRIMHDLLP